MCGVVTAFIDMAFDDGWRHPVIGKDEIDSTLFGLLVGVASGSSRFTLASEVVVADVCPTVFCDERANAVGKISRQPWRSPMISLGPGWDPDP